MDARPPAGTRADLVTDAAELGVALTERQLDEDVRRGLLASPQRVSLGKGHGQAPAVYSAEQRALFRVVLRQRVSAPEVRARKLALIPLHVWLYYGQDWVSAEQLNRAARTAVGSPRRSLTDAERLARALVNSVDLHGASHQARAALRRELIDQLNRARPDPVRLARLVGQVFEPGGLSIVRGPDFAPLTAPNVVRILHAMMVAICAVAAQQVTDAAWRTAREKHQDSWQDYETSRADYVQQAPDDLQSLFADGVGPGQSPDRALDILLLLIGIPLTAANTTPPGREAELGAR